jgi:hypothetical protein
LRGTTVQPRAAELVQWEVGAIRQEG